MIKQLTIIAIMVISGGIVGCVSTSYDLTTRAGLEASLRSNNSNLSPGQEKELQDILNRRFPTVAFEQAQIKEVQANELAEAKGVYDEFCHNKQQIKTFTFKQTFALDTDPQLSALQQMLENKKQSEVFEDEVKKTNYGKEALEGYYFFPSQATINNFLDRGSNYQKTYSQDECATHKVKRDADGLPYCLINKGGTDPVTAAKKHSVNQYLSKHKNIKKQMTNKSVTYLITYDLSGYCAKAIPVSEG